MVNSFSLQLNHVALRGTQSFEPRKALLIHGDEVLEASIKKQNSKEAAEHRLQQNKE